jgi:hypothetical protein
MEAVAKHEFNATADDELSFKRSQVLKVRFLNPPPVSEESSTALFFSAADFEYGRRHELVQSRIGRKRGPNTEQLHRNEEPQVKSRHLDRSHDNNI